MRGWSLGVACAIGCSGSVHTEAGGTPIARPIAPLSPAAAALPAQTPSPCVAGAADRVGEWRYALIAPLYAPAEDITTAELARRWQGGTLALTDASQTLLASVLGPPGESTEHVAQGTRPSVTDARWAIVPADELSPAWKVITVDGHHPLDPDRDGPLTVPLCAAGSHVVVRNIDPDALTTVTMTGVTAMARLTAVLMDKKGVTYPARDVTDWLAKSDVVHVSNEVSFVPTCEPKGNYTDPFCSREGYLALLDALHASVIELDGSHLSDFGWRWLTHSIEMYEARGWHFFGGGRDQLEATRPAELEHHGNRIAFLGCNMPRSTAHTIRNGPNVGFCDTERLAWQVRDLRRRGVFPIVAIQHEEVYTHDPPDLLVRDFRRLAEAGAAVVFGSQAHYAHPWEVHTGAYLHYGPGNFIFDQGWPGTREAAADRLYIHKGKLLAVGHLFTQIEERGRPRPMTERERVRFLRAMHAAAAKLPPAAPWATPHDVPPPRERPDSFLLGTEAILLAIAAPPGAAASACTGTGTGCLPLVIAFGKAAPARDDAFVVRLRHTSHAHRAQLARAIADFMVAKYPVDRARVAIR